MLDISRFLLDTLQVKTKAEQTVDDYKILHITMAKDMLNCIPLLNVFR